ncbi:hypothetical protein [Streptomyces sp. BBFR109]|uniref:hypothetical protein n=1 Tax=Streptomyces sp. BBFR109 TaxID=3448172 RepID=UPI003F764254
MSNILLSFLVSVWQAFWTPWGVGLTVFAILVIGSVAHLLAEEAQYKRLKKEREHDD